MVSRSGGALGWAAIVAATIVTAAQACGGAQVDRDATLPEAASEAGDEPVIFPPEDVQPPPRPDREIPDANHEPTCDDVGKYPGIATCCDGSYCAGYCLGGCFCDMDFTGCPWPLVCCKKGGCMTAELCQWW